MAVEPSIREFGFKIPCVVPSDGELVDGHLRLKAARKLGLAEIPVILCNEWSPRQVKAFRLLVNRSATWAGWDPELLALELRELDHAKYDLSLTGFDAAELDELLRSEPTIVDTAEAAPEAPVSVAGFRPHLLHDNSRLARQTGSRLQLVPSVVSGAKTSTHFPVAT